MSKINEFLETEKGKTWLRVFPDYFSPEYRKLSDNLVRKLLEDFTNHTGNKKGTN